MRNAALGNLDLKEESRPGSGARKSQSGVCVRGMSVQYPARQFQAGMGGEEVSAEGKGLDHEAAK
ncbi:MAG: hypothetical protein DWI57_06350 [Chloroflexi bacterium]|nr:MAG: hypothetical protein DWI57_06350 [Chloroflexota bacterium]